MIWPDSVKWGQHYLLSKTGRGKKEKNKDEMRTQVKKYLTHKRKLNNLLEYLHRQKNGKSHPSSRVTEGVCEDEDGSLAA